MACLAVATRRDPRGKPNRPEGSADRRGALSAGAVSDVRVSLPVLIAIFGALLAAPGARALPAFAGKVCALVPSKQVTAIAGLSSKCVNAKPSQGPGSMIYVGNWAGATPTSPTLQVTVAVYKDPGALKLAVQNLKQGLPGSPKKVTGIGSAAYESKGANAVGIHLVVGKYIAYINLNTIGAPPKSAVMLEPLAKTLATHL